jgi:hypothetical protein
MRVRGASVFSRCWRREDRRRWGGSRPPDYPGRASEARWTAGRAFHSRHCCEMTIRTCSPTPLLLLRSLSCSRTEGSSGQSYNGPNHRAGLKGRRTADIRATRQTPEPEQLPSCDGMGYSLKLEGRRVKFERASGQPQERQGESTTQSPTRIRQPIRRSATCIARRAPGRCSMTSSAIIR